MTKLDDYAIKAHKKHVEIINKDHFKQKQEKSQIFEDNFIKKLGLLSLSDILYKKERF